MNNSQSYLKGSKLEIVEFEEFISCPLREMNYLIRAGKQPDETKSANTTFETLIKPRNHRDLVVFTRFPGCGSECMFHDIHAANITHDYSKIELAKLLDSKRFGFWTSAVSRDEFDHPFHPPFYQIIGSKAAMAAEKLIEEKKKGKADE